jgi:ribonuclease HI
MITIYATGHSTPKDKHAGCAVVLLTTSSDGSLKRLMSFKLGVASLNLAVLQAARLGLMAIKPEACAQEVHLLVDHPYVVDMLQMVADGVGSFRYAKSPQANQGQVSDLRGWASRIPRLVVKRQVFNDGWGAECVRAAREAAEQQSTLDTGTRALPS